MSSMIAARFVGRAVALLGVSLSVSACATVTRGSNENFTIESSPPGALATTSNGFRCDSTPCTIRMPRKDGFMVTVSKPGYVTRSLGVQSTVSGTGGTAMAGNVIVGGIIGAGVDLATGAMKDLTPNPLVVELVPEQTQGKKPLPLPQ